MKKYIIFSFFVLSMFIHVSVFAQADIDPNPNTSSCVSLSNNLRYQSRDINTNGEVSTLQDFLQFKGYLNSEPTGYFGLLTVKAVQGFQNANGINGTGYVGPLTRAKISVVSCGGISAPLPISNDTSSYSPCSSGAIYNSVTGGKCSTTDSSFPSGCSSNSGYSSTTGMPCGGQVSVVCPSVSSTIGGYYSGYNNNLESNNTSCVTNKRPEPPFNVRIEEAIVVDGSAKIYWNNVDGEKFYIYKNKNDGIFQFLAVTSEKFYKDTTGLSRDVKYGYYITALNSYGESNPSSKVYVGPIVTPTLISPLTITTSSLLPNAKVGQSYSVTLNTSGVDPSNGYNWSVNNRSASFPVTGLSLGPSSGSSIRITGTPADVYLAGVKQTVPYTFTFTVTVQSGSQTADRQFTLTVDPATTTPTPIPTPTVFLSAYRISAGNPSIAYLGWSSTNATSCHMFSPFTGERINLATAGDRTISMTSTAAFFVTCSGPGGTTTSNSVTVIVDPVTSIPIPLAITTTSPLPNARVGNNYTTVLGVSGGPSGVSTNSYNWWTTSGFLPPMITLAASDSGEVLNGMPIVAGTYNFTINVSYGSQSGSKSFTITVNPATSTCSASGFDTVTGFRCGCISTSGYSSTDGQSCAISTSTATPSAYLSANGTNNLTVNVGDTINYTWSATNADTASSSYTINSPDTCAGGTGPFPWVANTINGSVSATVASCQSGRTYFINYTASKGINVSVYGVRIQVN